MTETPKTELMNCKCSMCIKLVDERKKLYDIIEQQDIALQEQARQRKETIKKIIESPNHDEFETLNAISYEIEKWG